MVMQMNYKTIISMILMCSMLFAVIGCITKISDPTTKDSESSGSTGPDLTQVVDAEDIDTSGDVKEELINAGDMIEDLASELEEVELDLE